MATKTIDRAAGAAQAERTARESAARGAITFVGTATTIVRLGEFTILTDPNFLHAGDHAHLGYGLRSERLTDPALEIEQLPPLDLCVLSHLHGDHWDRVAAEKLPKSLPIVTTRHAAVALGWQGFEDRRALEPWQSVTMRKADDHLSVTATPGRHAPPPIQALLPPVMGSMLEWRRGESAGSFRMHISGDTLMYHGVREIPERYPSIDVGLVHLGGTRIGGITVTMDAEQGLEWLRTVRPKLTVPIHYDDYRVFKSPLSEFAEAVERAGLEAKVRFMDRGDTFEFQLPSG